MEQVETLLTQKSYISCSDALAEIENDIYELLEKESIYHPAVAQVNAGSGFIDLTNDDDMEVFQTTPAVRWANARNQSGGTAWFMDVTSDDEMDSAANVPKSARSESRTLSSEPRPTSNRLDIQLILEPDNAANSLQVKFDDEESVEDLADYFGGGLPPSLKVGSIFNEVMSELEGQPKTELDSSEYLDWED